MNNQAGQSGNAASDENKPAIPHPFRKSAFLADLLATVDDPNHKRILGAYKQIDPVASMEAELSRILLEIVES